MADALKSIHLQIMWNRLLAVVEEQAQHRRTPVAVELRHPLAGVRAGRGEVQHEPLVERRAACIAERRQRRDARRRHRAGNARDEAPEIVARDAHHADAAAPGRRRDGGDGDRRSRWAHRQELTAPARAQ